MLSSEAQPLSLETLRKNIDIIDEEILKCLSRRVETVALILKEKQRLFGDDLRILNEERERVLLASLQEKNKTGLSDEQLQRIFQAIIRACREYQIEIHRSHGDKVFVHTESEESAMNSYTDDLGRLRWKCRRGMLELDLILLPFLDRHYHDLESERRAIFNRLLDEQDPVLQSWFMGFEQPKDPDFVVMVQDILSKIRG